MIKFRAVGEELSEHEPDFVLPQPMHQPSNATLTCDPFTFMSRKCKDLSQTGNCKILLTDILQLSKSCEDFRKLLIVLRLDIHDAVSPLPQSIITFVSVFRIFVPLCDSI